MKTLKIPTTKKPALSPEEKAAAKAERKEAVAQLTQLRTPDDRRAWLQPWLRRGEPVDREEYAHRLLYVRQLLQHRMSFVHEHTADINQQGLKADGTKQDLSKMPGRALHADAEIVLQDFQKIADAAIDKAEKALAEALEPLGLVYEWLMSIKGVSVVSAAHLLAHLDPYMGENVSKMWQYLGFNPGKVLGKKRMKAKAFRESMGRVIGKYPDERGNVVDVLVQTNVEIKADRRTKGFLVPYNGTARTGYLGIVAPIWLKQADRGNPYPVWFYYPYKNRLAHSDNMTLDWNPKTETREPKRWRDVSDGHRHGAAMRYMMKEFVKDLYVVWRTQLGLEVRCPYAEEYLGKTHHAGTPFDDVPAVASVIGEEGELDPSPSEA